MREHFRKTKGAIISPDGVYRYALWRIWSPQLPLLMCIGLNPSRADAVRDDPTIKKCTGFAVIGNFGGLLMGNLYAYRSTYPSELLKATDPVGPDNDYWLERMRDAAGLVLAGWGNHGTIMKSRVSRIRDIFPQLYHLGLTAAGQPIHPLARGKAFIPTSRELQLLPR